ncbi:MAG: hypothetical protein QOF62_841 [Pyrinomonadaceae bacterium]|jgi:uncharacterized membrane protein (DUF2068 family)|nr:hypothetical protein [Pyrinomonadaceae bacterium]
MAKNKKTKTRAKSRKGIWLIVVFKLLKGLTLLAVGLGALSLLHENVAAQVSHWIQVIRVDPDNHFIHAFIRKLWTVDDKKLVELSAGTFFYAAIVLTEGVGLALRKKWAEYFTIFATASLVPLEIYELVQEFSFVKIIVIAVNIAVVIYLAFGLRETKS